MKENNGDEIKSKCTRNELGRGGKEEKFRGQMGKEAQKTHAHRK